MKKNKILSASFFVALVSLIIKLLGLVKQSVLASVCGATIESDMFFVATGIVGQLAVAVFAALSTSLLSVYTRVKTENGNKRSNELINSFLRFFIPVSFLLALIFIVFAHSISHIIAPSYDEDTIAEMAKFVRLSSIAFIPWCYYLTINVVLESDKVFLPGRFQGFFQNTLLIIAALTLYKSWGSYSLVIAFLLSGVLESIIVTISARKKISLVFYRTNCFSYVKKIIVLAGPLIIGNAVYEINDIVDKQLSIGLGDGNVSLLSYGGTLNEIVTGIVVGSVAVVLYSHFVSFVVEKNYDELKSSINKSIEILVLLTIPIMIMCVLCGDSIITILYGRGAFGQDEIIKTNAVLIGYSLGFVFQSVRAVFSKVLFAFDDTKSPMINGIISISINIALSILLSRVLGVFGISLATSISIIIVSVLLFFSVKKKLPNYKIKGTLFECAKCVLAGIVSSIITYLVYNYFPSSNIYYTIIVTGLSCVISYIIILFMINSKPLISALGK